MKSPDDTTGGAAPHTPKNWLQHGVQALELLGTLNAMVSRFGGQRSRNALGPVVLFTGGAFVGVAAVLMLAPSAGAKLRRRIAIWIDSGAFSEEARVDRAIAKENHLNDPV